ncbi:hypothetical protein OIDMADRAFT_51133 [Oidiodendron maius Zn]|uniref:Uncharacterized protein n=1 Tax=Oidiodendron maius (strain Zn) TaxID=913774 RepID=A0A0C3DTC0_OIDMZ|nr:hypothetical protein OIDMADRAFT_51133 [Oidiodendron maius Zn]
MLEAEQLARSTGALATVRMIFIPGTHYAWTLLRITLPALMIVIGTIQKIHAGIIYEITPYNGTILVWAGLTQMNPVVLDSIPTSTMAVYFLAWTPNLLSVPQFIWTLPPTDRCTNNSVTYIQPGGVEIARLWSKDLNQTLLQNGYFDLADVIQIYNAPAIVTEFDELTDDLIFQTDECELFTPLSNDAIYICIKPAEFGTAVIGWTICPSAHYWAGTCVSNVSWTDEICQATTVATYTLFSTTSYYNKTLSIINVIETSQREILPIDINGFKAT